MSTITVHAGSANKPSPSGVTRPHPFFTNDMPFARFGLLVNGFVPLCLLIIDARHHQLGSDPVNFATHTTGLVALIFLWLSLCVTPLRGITGFSWLIQFRRTLGLYAFFYACCHLGIYYWWDRSRSFSSTIHEITHRKYLLIGFISLSLMAPLAATSFNAAIRALGGKKWKALHRAAYISAILGIIHYYIEVKADVRQPRAFVYVLIALLGYRVVVWFASLRHRRSTADASGKLRFWKGALTISQVRQETPNIRTYRLVPTEGGKIPFRFSAGQFLNVSLPIQGKKVNRSYTIASPPTRDDYVELTIKREDKGTASIHVHDMLMMGNSIDVSAPAGRFTFDQKSAMSVLLIAGGVGITPVMSMLRYLSDCAWPGEIDLLFIVRTRSDIIYADELEMLSQLHHNVRVRISLTRDIPPDWNGLRGRITPEMLRLTIKNLDQRMCFICGPNEMAASARQALLNVGVGAKRIKVESFTPASAVASDQGKRPVDESAMPDSAATVTFETSGQSAPLPAKQSILEAAEGAGVSIDYDCRSGICGRCRVKLITGEVTMAVQDALSDADIEDGFILACQAHASMDVSIDA